MGFIAGFVGLVVHSLGTNTFILVRIMEPFWFFVGIIAVLPMIRMEQPAPAEKSGRPFPSRFVPPLRSPRLPLIFPSRPGKGAQLSGREVPRG